MNLETDHRKKGMGVRTLRQAASLLLATALLGACAPMRHASYKDEIKNSVDMTSDLLSRTGEAVRVERLKGDFIPMEAAGDRKPLSAQLLKPITFNQTNHNMRDFARQLESLSGVQVDVAPEAMTASQFGVPVALNNQPVAPVVPPQLGRNPAQGPLPALPPLPGQALSNSHGTQGAVVTDTDRDWRVVYEGTVAGLLDSVTRRFDLSWEEIDGHVLIKRFVTRSFRLVALAGATSGTSTISSHQSASSDAGGTGGTSGSGQKVSTGQTATVSFEGLSPWSAIEATTRNMLTAEGHLSVNPALGTLTVIDRQSAVERVSEFVKSTNNAMGRQVALNVRVYNVQFNDKDQFAIDWSLVNTSLGNSVTLTNASGLAASTGANLGLKILSGSGSANAGSSAILSALSSQGRVSQQVSTTLVTLNNQPVPLQVVRQQSYLATITTTQSANVGSSTSLTPGQVNAGLDMSFVPHVLDDGRILLQYTLNLSDIVSIDAFGANGSQIQLPNVNVRSFIQRVSVNSGETLVMSGFEQNNVNDLEQGVGTPQNFLFGGGQKAGRDRTVVVIVVQPTLI
jgi:type IVB pilus formation R64 PilN family outer membrane protein